MMDSNDESDASENEIGESEKSEIRAELSKMSFQDLQKLKAKLGAKVYKEAFFGVKSVKETKFKRKHKDQPREVSSKIKPKLPKVNKLGNIRDPRFDQFCGKFDESKFKKSYGFITDMKKEEKIQLKKELKREKDPEKKEKIKKVVQRMENQEREEAKRSKMMEKEKEERKEQLKAFNSGRKPLFKTKYEKKVLNLIEQYSELKNSGKVQKHIQKFTKKRNLKQKKANLRERYFNADLNE